MLGACRMIGTYIVLYSLVLLWSTLAFLRALWVIVRSPRAALRKSPRDIPPDCLKDESLGTHQYVKANGVTLHCVCAGDKSKPLMLFLHGFPEFWFSWRHQIREFAGDYYVVAVDMRGYGDSERPPNKRDYLLSTLRQDVVELVGALGYSSCVLVAHDWGGVVAWRAVQHRPDLFDRFIVMNCPHASVYKKQFSTGWSQFMKSWYILLFQMPWLPEFIFGLNDYIYFNAVFRGKKSGAKNKDTAFPPDVLDAYKYTFSKPGAMTSPLNYYRCMFNEMKRVKGGPRPKPIEVPTLILWGDNDAFLDRGMADMHERVATNLTVRHIPDCSHWVQQDCPQLTNQYMWEFLKNVK